MKHNRFAPMRTVFAACALSVLTLVPGARAAEPKLTFAIPGIPAIYGGVIALVAQQQGLFKKYGVDVTVRQFDTGASASRAVASGEIALALSPTPLVVSQVSNTDVKLVGVYGMEHPDWLIGSTDPNATCASLKGQPVSVDAVGGARSIALKTMLIGGCKMSIDDVQQVALSSNGPAALAAGQLKYGVLHIDDVPFIESQTKKPIKIIVKQKDSRPVDHYMLVVANKDKLAQNRDAYVRVVAALIDAQRFMRNPANAAKVAEAAKPTGRSADLAEKALKAYIDMQFWPEGNDGMDRKNIETLTQVMKKVGNIKPDKTPAPFERVVDPSVWRDANAMVKP